MTAKKSKALKAHNKAQRKLKKQEKALQNEILDQARRDQKALLPAPPPNNPYGITNSIYSKYRPWIEKSMEENAHRKTLHLNFERFRLHRKLPDNLHTSDEIVTFAQTFITSEWPKSESFSQSTRHKINGAINTITRRDHPLPEIIHRSPIIKGLRSTLGFPLAAIFFDEDSLHLTFHPLPHDNDQAPIRTDFDFTFQYIYPYIAFEWFRAGEIHATQLPHDHPLQQLTQHHILFAWSLFSDHPHDDSHQTIHALFSNHHILTISISNQKFSLHSTPDLTALTTLPDATQVIYQSFDS